MEFSFGFGRSGAQAAKARNAPFTILVLSDFSGRAGRRVREPLSTRRPLPVTIDNHEKVFASLDAALALNPAEAGEPRIHVSIGALEDFHPDQLLRRLESLDELFCATTELKVPAKAEEAAGRLQRLLTSAQRPTPPDTPQQVQDRQPPAAPPENDHATLTRLLGIGGTESGIGSREKTESPVGSLIRHALDSSKAVAPSAPVGMEGLRAAAELELSARLRRILHDPQFQAVEAAWRSVDFLLRNCPDEERIRFSILDVTLDELSSEAEGLRRLLRDTPPDLIVGNYAFGQTKADLEALGVLGALCAELGVRFVGGGHPALAGCAGFDRQPDPDDWNQPLPGEIAELWTGLRESAFARCIGLALPRFLLRQPYGKGSDPIEGYDFEEVVAATDHETFLWGNSSFLCAHAIAVSVAAQAEGMEVEEGLDLHGLPVFRFRDKDGESAMKPCAEAWLVDRAMNALLRRGLIPVLSINGSDAVRLPGFASISKQG